MVNANPEHSDPTVPHLDSQIWPISLTPDTKKHTSEEKGSLRSKLLLSHANQSIRPVALPHSHTIIADDTDTALTPLSNRD